jgi:hypothetical protein
MGLARFVIKRSHQLVVVFLFKYIVDQLVEAFFIFAMRFGVFAGRLGADQSI